MTVIVAHETTDVLTAELLSSYAVQTWSVWKQVTAFLPSGKVQLMPVGSLLWTALGSRDTLSRSLKQHELTVRALSVLA